MPRFNDFSNNMLNQINNGTRIILISGAFGCGKTQIANKLSDFLNKKGINNEKVCMNSFFKSKAQIILDTYFSTHFNFFDKNTYKNIIKNIEKYEIPQQIKEIRFKLTSQVGALFAEKIIQIIKNNEKNIDFNAKIAINYKKCADFCNSVTSFYHNTVLIVYGAHALNNAFTYALHNKNYKVFVNCNNNTLLLRNFNKKSLHQQISFENINNVFKNLSEYKKYNYERLCDEVYVHNLSQNEIADFKQINNLKFDVQNHSYFMYKQCKNNILKNYYFSCLSNQKANYYIKIQQINGSKTEIKFVLKSTDTLNTVTQIEKSFNITNQAINPTALCALFVKAGYPYAGSVRKNQAQYKYKDVNFDVNTDNSAKQILKIKSGTKDNIKHLINMLSNNNIQLAARHIKDENYENQR